MKIYYLLISIVLLATTFPNEAFSQKKDYGKVNGSVDSQSGYYFEGSDNSAGLGQTGFATNTYLNLGYTFKRFNAGLQYEIYEPPLVGYSPHLKGNKLMMGFAEYLSPKFSARLGNMYEQFGSGLVFRAYEDRTLGFNNSLLGVNLRYSPVSSVQLKLIAGAPRKFLKYIDTRVYGADATVGLLSLMGVESDASWNVGGSWVKRDDNSKTHIELYPRDVNLYSVRSNFNKGIFTLGAEYATKSQALFSSAETGFNNVKGNVLLANFGLSASGIGGTLDFRRVESFQVNVDDVIGKEFVAFNFVPALTKQHKYTLAALFPHRLIGVGEIGGQMELFSSITIDEEEFRELSLSLNASRYNALVEKGEGEGYKFIDFGGKVLFEELGLEAQYPFSDKFEATVGYVYQKNEEFSRLGFGQMVISSQTVIGDLLYRFNDKHSLRMELQHQWSTSKDDQRWALGLLEYGFAPKLMIYGSLMSNYQTEGEATLYYTAGASYNFSRLRLSLGVNRVRAGYLCSGGVCRYVPEHSGAILSVNYSF